MQREVEMRAIEVQLLELQDRAYRAGLPTLEYLLEMAIVETGNELKKQRKKRGSSNVTSLNNKKIINS